MAAGFLARLTPARWLGLIVAAAFVFTLGYALHFKIVPQVDAAHYASIAGNIAAGAGYRIASGTPIASDDAIASVGPLYEFFLALFFRIFGSADLAVIWLAQTLLDIGTGLLLFLIARRVFEEGGEWIGVIAAGLYLFCIDIIEMPAMLMTETLFLFFIVLSTYLFVRFYQRPSLGNAALLGIASAFAIMTRPTALLILALALFYALFARRFAQALLMLACAALMIAPWTIRNYETYHSFILTTAAGGYDLWLGNTPATGGGAHPTPEMVSYASTHDFTATSAYGTKQFENFIFNHPLAEAELLVEKGIAYFSIARPYGFWFYLSGRAQEVVLAWSALWSFALFSLGLAGAWLMLRGRRPLHSWLLALAALMPLSVIPIIVETRYRLPLYPFLALFAGYFILRLYRDRGEWKVLIVAAALVIGDGALDALRNIGLIVSRLGL
jgi:hypothetical protein